MISVNNKGFTLAELLVALTIFAIGLLAVAGMQVTALNANVTANEVTAATAVARGAMEEILAMEADDPLLEIAVTDAVWGTRDLAGAGVVTIKYTVEPGEPVASVSRITVTAEAANRSVSVVGYRRTAN